MMRKRLMTALLAYEIELYENSRTNLGFYQSMLDFIATGNRVVDDGDITGDEFRKATWWVATYKARIAKFEYELANDNEVYADEELSDLVRSGW